MVEIMAQKGILAKITQQKEPKLKSTARFDWIQNPLFSLKGTMVVYIDFT